MRVFELDIAIFLVGALFGILVAAMLALYRSDQAAVASNKSKRRAR
jgi:hypothetical protein